VTVPLRWQDGFQFLWPIIVSEPVEFSREAAAEAKYVSQWYGMFPSGGISAIV
jgi:hypothetical protein